VDYRWRLDRAIGAPRIHHQWQPDLVIAERSLAPRLKQALQRMGHTVSTERWKRIGHANCIEVDPETRRLRAVADVNRGGGRALAY
jgi:gamma-glutamyltranspeptidase/glutathione hydrolase